MRIPSKIQALIKSGNWRSKHYCDLEQILKRKYGWVEEIILDKPSKNGLSSVKSNPDYKSKFGLYLTGEFEDSQKLDFLDVNKCLMISCNYADEAICLDYRFSNEEPQVMASDYSNKNGRWIKIVDSIDELIEKLGINKIN